MPKNNGFRMRFEMQMNAASEEAEIMVYGEICTYKWDDSDMTANEFSKLMKDAKAQGAKRLRLRVNSPGGSVFQAIAIRSMLNTSGFEEINIDIEGLCASAATFFCIPAAHVRIAEYSQFMIHRPINIAFGTAEDMEKEAEHLHMIEKDIIDMYCQRTGQSEEQIHDWVYAETWFSAKEAVQYGFCDELVEAEDAAACVSGETLDCMRGIYAHVPDMAVAPPKSGADAQRPCGSTDPGTDQVSKTEPGAEAGSRAETGEVTENNKTTEGEDDNVEIKDMTAEQLHTENPALHESIMQAGAAQERERIQEIDDLTPAGYEDMAAEAKKNGTSPVDFCKAIAKAQREKGKAFVENRKAETEPANNVTGGASADDNAGSEDEIRRNAAEIANLAKEFRDGKSGGMY